MKYSKIIFTTVIALTFLFVSCGENTSTNKTENPKEDAHAHGPNGEHLDQTKVMGQEEFNVNEGLDKKEVKVKVDELSNEATIVVKANKALEYKFKVNQYEKLTYEWKASSPLHYDFHGDPEVKENYPKGYFESYAIGDSDHAKGKITIPYKGSHGWYWKNESGKDITITLSTQGKYQIIGLLQ